jgi:hypothetical protein
MRRAFLIACCLLFVASTARGHALDVAYLELEAQGPALRASLDLSAEIAEQLVRAGPLRTQQEASSQARALLFATLGSGALEVDGAACALGDPEATAQAGRVRLRVQARCPREVRELRWTFPFVDVASLDYRVLVKAVLLGEERNFILEPGASTLRIGAARTRNFASFVAMGVRHIGAMPDEWRDASGWHLPGGIDHIHFLLALILAGGSLWRTLAVVTGFTLGHSITLALATLQWVQLPSRLVESLIALSIAWVALEDAFAKDPQRHRFWIAAGFGLVHGFGFASALSELHLTRAGLASALVGFNLGVELGQATIVALLAPLVMLLRRREWFRRIGVRICGGLIAMAGLYWFVQRAFF